MEQILEKLFDSIPKARILRLFMQNPDQSFTFEEITQKCNVKKSHARKETNKFLKLRIILEKTITLKKELTIRQTKKKKSSRPLKSIVYTVNQDFEVFQELRNLAIKSSITSRKSILQKVKKLGRIRLAMIAGTLINNDRGRTDLLLVADDIPKGKLERFLSELESEVGKQVHYTLMSGEEFTYRTNMYDRFLRDILESPHEKLINRLNI
jgi:hypothetical protein